MTNFHELLSQERVVRQCVVYPIEDYLSSKYSKNSG